MSAPLHVGCCGWSYLRPKEFEPCLKQKYKSTLQAYTQLLDTVEINSTFYRIPRVTTAEKWSREAADIRPGFEFTVKAYQGITHMDRFGRKSRGFFDATAAIAHALKARVMLFQSPASFHPTSENIRKITGFFDRIDRGAMTIAWEPRGEWLESTQALVDVLEACNLVHCVDPLRTQALSFGKDCIAYFRLHGFGKPSMYRYDFSREELEAVRDMVTSLGATVSSVYVFFNNVTCYHNARTFVNMMGVV